MSGALDGMLVALALAVSVGYAMCTLGPRAWRRRLLTALAALLLHLPAAARLQALARRLQGAASQGTGACGGCDDCGATPTEPPGAAGSLTEGAARAQPPAEFRVPVASIGKRR